MHPYMRIGLKVLVVMIVLNVSTAWAQQPPGSTNADADVRRWAARISFGSARIHSWDERAEWMDIRFARFIRSGMTSIDFGISGSGSRGPFTSLTFGVEVRPRPLALVSPFVRTEVGLLGESDYGGIVAGIGGGAVFRLNSRFGLRAGIALNVHGRAKGPVTSYGGLEYRW